MNTSTIEAITAWYEATNGDVTEGALKDLSQLIDRRHALELDERGRQDLKQIRHLEGRIETANTVWADAKLINERCHLEIGKLRSSLAQERIKNAAVETQLGMIATDFKIVKDGLEDVNPGHSFFRPTEAEGGFASEAAYQEYMDGAREGYNKFLSGEEPYRADPSRLPVEEMDSTRETVLGQVSPTPVDENKHPILGDELRDPAASVKKEASDEDADTSEK